MFTATADLILPSTVTGSWPRPRWFDVSMWGEPLDTCMMDVRFREKFQDALAVVISDEERAGSTSSRTATSTATRTWRAARGITTRSSDGRGSPATTCSRRRRARRGCTTRPARCSTRSTPAGAGRTWSTRSSTGRSTTRRCGGWRRRKTRKPVRFGTCCSQVMALFLDIHTPKYKDKRQVIWDMAEAMNKELLALRDAGCRLHPGRRADAALHGEHVREGPRRGAVHDRRVQPRGRRGSTTCEMWIHTCWGNPNMQRVMEDTSYAASIEMYLERCQGDVWTLEMKDRNQKDIELFAPFKQRPEEEDLRRRRQPPPLQADRAEDVAGEIRKALVTSRPSSSIVSSDCGFGRQGCNREIAFYKASRHRAGLQHRPRRARACRRPTCRATDPQLQIDVVEKKPADFQLRLPDCRPCRTERRCRATKRVRGGHRPGSCVQAMPWSRPAGTPAAHGLSRRHPRQRLGGGGGGGVGARRGLGPARRASVHRTHGGPGRPSPGPRKGGDSRRPGLGTGGRDMAGRARRARDPARRDATARRHGEAGGIGPHPGHRRGRGGHSDGTPRRLLWQLPRRRARHTRISSRSAPPMLGSIVGHMVRHQDAANLLLEGLIVPSAAA